jgi:methyltransferase family protein
MNPLWFIRTFANSSFIRSRFPLLPATYEFIGKYRRRYFPIYLDYPIVVLPRYGYGTPPHGLLYSLINKNREAYAALIKSFASYKKRLKLIPISQPTHDPSSPYWCNGWVEGIDAVSLYTFPSLFKSNMYMEIGSGNSTKFVRRSIDDNCLKTKIISIDPQPRADIDSLCDTILRSPLESVSGDLFDELQAGDILMVDCSHRCFQNSDVTTVFLDILPRLKEGVFVYVDDIFLPYDYPPEWATYYFSEQYLLAVMLLADAARRYEILLPAWFIRADDELRSLAEESWKEIGVDMPYQSRGCGFWMQVKSPARAA